MRNRRGFTLIEIMVMVGVLGLLTAIAIPSINSYVRSNQLSTSVDMMTSDLKMARSMSISKGRPMLFAAFDNRYVIFDNVDGRLIVDRECEGNVAVETNIFVQFYPWGMSDPGTIDLKNTNGSTRSINILPTGIVEVN